VAVPWERGWAGAQAAGEARVKEKKKKKRRKEEKKKREEQEREINEQETMFLKNKERKKINLPLP
jgi:ribosomal protein L12E/L44/L45/RPP1/RPP2